MNVGREVAEVTDRIFSVSTAICNMSGEGGLCRLDGFMFFLHVFLSPNLNLFFELLFEVNIVNFEEVVLSLELSELPF